jgi:hypothetical protein
MISALGDVGYIAHGALDTPADTLRKRRLMTSRNQGRDRRRHQQRNMVSASQAFSQNISPKQRNDGTSRESRISADHRIGGGLRDLLGVVGQPRQQLPGGTRGR